MPGPGGADAGRLAVRVLPDTSKFARSLLRYLERIEARTVLKIRAEVNLSTLAESARSAISVVENLSTVHLKTEVDTVGVVPEARRVAAVASRSATVRLGVELDTAHVLAGLAGLVGGAGKVGALVGSLATAVPHVLALVSALVSSAPAAAVAVPALAGVVAVVGAMRLAVHGVSDALSAAASGDAEAYAAALAKLSPSARGFVREAAALIPTLRAVRTAVQEAFFARLDDGLLTRVAGNLLPTLRAGLVGIAATAGEAARNVGLFLSSGAARTSLSTLFAGIQASLGALVRVPAQLVQVFTRVGATAAPALARLSAGLAGVIDRFTLSVDRAAGSGALAAMIDRALDLLAQLVQIGGNVARIIGNILSASDTSLLDTIERITGAVADFANSAAGQALLGQLLTVLATAGPVVVIASGIASAVSAVGAALAAVATPVGAVVALAAALALGLTLAYQRIGPLRDAVQATFGALAPIVAGSIGTIVGWLRGQLVPAIGALVSRVAPILAGFAATWREVVLPAIVQVAHAYQAQLQPTLDRITDVIATKVQPAVDALTAAYLRNKPQIDQLVGGIASAIVWLNRAVALVAGPVVRALVSLGGAILGHGIRNLGRMIDILGATIRWLSTVSTAAGRFGSAVATGTSTALAWIRALPGQIRNAVGNLGGLLYNAGRSLVQGLINGVGSMIRAAINTVYNLGRSLINAAEDALGIRSPSVVFAGIGAQTVAGFVEGIENAQPRAKSAMRGLLAPPRAPTFDPADLSASGGGAPIYVLAQIGDRPVTEMVEATVAARPERFAQVLRGGERSLARRG